MVSYQSGDTPTAELLDEEVGLRGMVVIRDQRSFVRGQRLGVSMGHAVDTCAGFLTLLTPSSLYLNAAPDAPRPVLDDELRPAMRRRAEHEMSLREEGTFTPAAVRPVIYPVCVGVGDNRDEIAEQVRVQTGLDLSSMWTASPFPTLDHLDQQAAATVATELLDLLAPCSDEPIRVTMATRGNSVPADSDLVINAVDLLGGHARRPGSPETWVRILAALQDVESTLSAKLPARQIVLTPRCHLTAAIAAGRIFNQTGRWELIATGRHGAASRPPTSDGSPARIHWEEGVRVSRVATVEIDLIGHKITAMVDEELRGWATGPRGRLTVTRNATDDLDPEQTAAVSRHIAERVRTAASDHKLSELHLFITAPADVAVLLGHQLSGMDVGLQLYEYDGHQYRRTLLLPGSLP